MSLKGRMSISPNFFAKQKYEGAHFAKITFQFHQHSPQKLCSQFRQIYDLKFDKSLCRLPFAIHLKKRWLFWAKRCASMLMKSTLGGVYKIEIEIYFGNTDHAIDVLHWRNSIQTFFLGFMLHRSRLMWSLRAWSKEIT